MANEDGPIADEEVERAVGDRLFSDPKVAIDSSIVVSVENGEVTLRGTVPSFADKRAARRAALRVEGVKSVTDELETTGPSDMDLEHAVREALELDGRTSTAIDVTVDEGTATLTGRTHREIQRDAAGFIARNVPGVVAVKNQVAVEQSSGNAPDARDPIERAFDRLASLDPRASTEGGEPTRLDLRDRLASALQRIERIRSDSEASGNVVQFHLARYVESLESDAVDSSARLAALSDDESYEWRILERDVAALEAEVAVADAKLDAAWAEESGDRHGEIEAQIRAFKAETATLRAEMRRQPPEGGISGSGHGQASRRSHRRDSI